MRMLIQHTHYALQLFTLLFACQKLIQRRLYGIVGIVERDLDRPVASHDLEQMVRMLVHRGPDEEGTITMPAFHILGR